MPHKQKRSAAKPGKRTGMIVDSKSAELVARWSGGDEGAAREIFQRYVDRLTRLARVRLSAKLAARLDADDVVMSAYRSFFVGARDGRFTLKESGDLWRLLAEITMHKLYRAAAHHRAQRRAVARETSGDVMAGRLEDLISREPAPHEVAALADELEAIMAALPPVARRVLELRLQGDDVNEIAQEIRRSPKTVRRWLEVAKQLLRTRQASAADSALTSRRWISKSNVESRPRPSPATRRRRKIQIPHPQLNYGDYLLLRLIGSGAVGKVYVASCRKTSKDVAVKFLRKSVLRHPGIVSRFLDEAAVLARLRHQGIIRLHGLGTTRSGGLFIVMDLASGGDLAQRIAAGRIPIADAVHWTMQAAEAIHHAHEHRVIHCDLKPSNLLLDADGRVVVTDFGLARHDPRAEDDAAVIAGTPAFMAPEQVDDCWGKIGPRTDVYELGAVLYTLLTGKPPVSGVRVADILAAIVSGQPVTPPDRLRRDVPPELCRLCMRCLAKRPADRFTCAADVVHALSDCGRFKGRGQRLR